jgi:hypothetical protein
VADDDKKDQENGQEEKSERVELGDVIRVLAKHSPVPNDPDDADLLGRFNAQSAEEQAEPQDTKTAEEKDDDDKGESPQQGSPQRGSPTSRTTSTRKDK